MKKYFVKITSPAISVSFHLFLAAGFHIVLSIFPKQKCIAQNCSCWREPVARAKVESKSTIKNQ
jgi:hypothetical protein